MPMITLPVFQLRRLVWMCGLMLLIAACSGATTRPAATPTADQVSCPTPLGGEMLSQLRIEPGPSFDLQPGQSNQMKVGVLKCCYVFEPKTACVVWSVSPNQHVSIDATSGLLQVDAAAAPD